MDMKIKTEAEYCIINDSISSNDVLNCNLNFPDQKFKLEDNAIEFHSDYLYHDLNIPSMKNEFNGNGNSSAYPGIDQTSKESDPDSFTIGTKSCNKTNFTTMRPILLKQLAPNVNGHGNSSSAYPGIDPTVSKQSFHLLRQQVIMHTQLLAQSFILVKTSRNPDEFQNSMDKEEQRKNSHSKQKKRSLTKRKDSTTDFKERNIFCASEDTLLALGLFQFTKMDVQINKLETLNILKNVFFPNRTVKELQCRIKKLQSKRFPPETPVKFLSLHKTLPAHFNLSIVEIIEPVNSYASEFEKSNSISWYKLYVKASEIANDFLTKHGPKPLKMFRVWGLHNPRVWSDNFSEARILEEDDDNEVEKVQVSASNTEYDDESFTLESRDELDRHEMADRISKRGAKSCNKTNVTTMRPILPKPLAPGVILEHKNLDTNVRTSRPIQPKTFAPVAIL